MKIRFEIENRSAPVFVFVEIVDGGVIRLFEFDDGKLVNVVQESAGNLNIRKQN